MCIPVEQSMRNIDSLKNTSQFKQVYEHGRSEAGRLLVVYALATDDHRQRLGISVSKKVGNSVVRHRFCRLVREAYRLHEDLFNSGLDIVVVARRGTDKCGFHEISGSLMHLAKVHHVIKD